MTLTPTDKGSGIAGIALALIGWASIFKFDAVAKLCRVDRWLGKEKMLDWIVRNRTLALLITEIINFATHGVTSASSVLFAVGSTLVNAIMIMVVLPLRAKARGESKVVIMSAA